MPPDDWSTRTADAIGRRVRDLRRARKLTVQQLSDALAEHGVIINRPVLSNLENGTRHTVSAAELMVLARALDVPPLLLILPLGSSEQVEVLPGVVDDAWTAYRWFVGELPAELLGAERDPAVRWSRVDDAGRLVDTYKVHHNGLHGFLAASVGRSEDDRRRLQSLGALAGARMKMHREGWLLPPIPDDVRPDLDAELRRWGFRVDGNGIAELGPDERVEVDLGGGAR